MNKVNALAVYSFSRNLGMSSSNIFLPFFLIEKNMVGLTGIFFSSIACILFLMGPVSGMLSDTYGRKRLMQAGASLYGIAALLFTAAIFTDSLLVIVAGTSLMNFSFILSEPAVSAGLAETIPQEKRGTGIGRFQTITESTMVVGPLIGGMAISASLHLFALFFAFTFIISVLALMKIDREKTVQLGTFNMKSRLSFLLSRKMLFLYAALTSVAASLFPVVVFIALFGTRLTPVLGGVLISLFLAVNLVLNIPSGMLADRYGCVPVLLVAAVLGVLTPIPLAISTELPFFVISLLLFGASMGFFEVAFQTLVAEKVDSSVLAFTYGSLGTVGDVVRIPIPLVVTTLFQNNQVILWSLLICMFWILSSMILHRWHNDFISSPPHE